MNLTLLEHNRNFTVLTVQDDFTGLSYYVLDHDAQEAWIINHEEHFDGMAIIRQLITMMNGFFFFGGRGEFATLDVNLKIGRFVCKFIKQKTPTDYSRLHAALNSNRVKQLQELHKDL